MTHYILLIHIDKEEVCEKVDILMHFLYDCLIFWSFGIIFYSFKCENF